VWRTYRLYGLAFESNFPFAAQLPSTHTPADLRFTCLDTAPFGAGELQGPPVYTSHLQNALGQSICSFYCLPEFDLLRFPGTGDFYLGCDQIVCQPTDPDNLEGVELYFLGAVLSCWLERSGVPCLHSSAVVADGGAVGFLSFNGGGKSSLGAAMVQGGCPLLTDDVLAVESNPEGFSGRHGYPQMRLWPTEADHFWGPAASLARVHPDTPKVIVPVGNGGFGAFEDSERPLTRFYLPMRRPPSDHEAAVEFETLSRRDALIEFVRHSFVASLAEAAGWQARRLDFFARLAAAVPVKRLIYPSGLEHLPRVRDAILADLETR